jgi:glutamyl-tRNA reductase
MAVMSFSSSKSRCPIFYLIGMVQLIIIILTGISVPVSAFTTATTCPYVSARQVFTGRSASMPAQGQTVGIGNVVGGGVVESLKHLVPFMQTMRGGYQCGDGADCGGSGQQHDPGRRGEHTVLRIGISHKDAAVGLREKLATAEKNLNDLSDALCTTPSKNGDAGLKISEAMVLSTCNRFELFLVANDPKAAAEHVFRVLSERTKAAGSDAAKHVEVDTLRSTMRVIVGAQATSEHLFRLTAGLDSIVLGEPQVLGQVKTAWEIARDKAGGGRAGAVLASLFNSAIKTTGRVRSETALSRGSMSVSSTAVGFSMGRLLADTGIPAIAKARVVVVGNGKMARLLFQNLQLHGVKDVTVVCRSEDKVREIQKEISGSTLHFVPMSGLADAIASADIVFPCTSAPAPIITPDMLLSSLSAGKRAVNPFLSGQDDAMRKSAMQIIDISVPRNVHNDVNSAAFGTALKKQTGQAVSSYNVDDLKSLMTQNALMRQNEVKEAERIIEHEVGKYLGGVKKGRKHR